MVGECSNQLLRGICRVSGMTLVIMSVAPMSAVEVQRFTWLGKTTYDQCRA
jgi:hypothetical protein